MFRTLTLPIHLSLMFWALPLLSAPMTLDEIYKRAVSRSENLGRFRLDALRQEQSIRAAQAAGGSRVQTQGGLDHVWTKVPARSWKSDVSPQIQTEWRYPLYDGGSVRSRIEGARRLVEAAQWDLADQREELFLQCAQLFYDVLSTEQDLKNLRESEAIYRERVETLEKRARIGRSRTAEALAARTQLQVIRSQSVDAQKRLHLNQERLAWLADAPPPLQLNDQLSLDLLQNKATPIPPRSVPLPSVEAAQARIAAAEQRIQTERAQTNPKLDFVAAHRWAFPNDINTHNLSFGLGLTWVIYDAGQIEANVAGLSLEKQQAVLSADLSRREEQLNNSLIRREWDDGLTQLKDLELALKAAQQNVKVQQQEFENGLLTNLEVMQAFDTRLQVKRSIDQTIYRTKYVYLEAQVRAGQIPSVREGVPVKPAQPTRASN